jgi:hypothetical protein
MKEFVGSCDVCAWANNLCHQLHNFLQPLFILASPWFSISMDFIINLPFSNSYDSILVVVVCLTKMVHFISCTKIITNKGTTKLFFDHVFQYRFFWKYHFWLCAYICIQVLETTLWTYKCESEIFIIFPPLDRWVNKTCQSSIGTIFIVHNQWSSIQLVRTFGHDKIYLQQHNAFINSVNTFICKSWFDI